MNYGDDLEKKLLSIKDDAWKGACLDVFDTMDLVCDFYEARNVSFSASDVTEITKLIIEGRNCG